MPPAPEWVNDREANTLYFAASGIVVLFGSGETSASGQKAFDWLFRHLTQPLRVAVLETPAGFELNSDRVAGRIGDFLCDRLQNYRPEVILVPARQRGTPYSPDSPEIVAPLLSSNVLFLGPGSPTYAVRQLRDSLAWHTLQARHRWGLPWHWPSAATLAVGCLALPVYEIYKVGEDLHWKPGLDLFGPFGLPLVILPHWNNNDGGDELDTSRCFMGRAVSIHCLPCCLPASPSWALMSIALLPLILQRLGAG